MNRIFVSLIALSSVFAASAQDVASLTATYAEAAEALKVKNFSAAVPLFEEVIDKGLDVEGAETIVAGAKQALPQAVFMLGGGAFQSGKLDEALRQFSKSAELAELYGNMNVLGRARTWISNTVSKQGEDAFNSKDFATAAAIFQKGYDANPNDTALAMNLALSYSGLKQFDKSAAIYRNIIALAAADSRFADAATKAREGYSSDVIEGANASAKSGDYAAAIAALDEFLTIVPDDAAAAYNRLSVYNSMKNYAKVVELGEVTAAAQVSDEMRSGVWFLVGAAHQNQSAWAKAIEAYRKVTAGGNVAAAKAQITELQKVAN